jgi:hypothetical protein
VSKGATWATTFVPTQLILQMTFLFGDLLICSTVPAHHLGPLGSEITAKPQFAFSGPQNHSSSDLLRAHSPLSLYSSPTGSQSSLDVLDSPSSRLRTQAVFFMSNQSGLLQVIIALAGSRAALSRPTMSQLLLQRPRTQYLSL